MKCRHCGVNTGCDWDICQGCYKEYIETVLKEWETYNDEVAGCAPKTKTNKDKEAF